MIVIPRNRTLRGLLFLVVGVVVLLGVAPVISAVYSAFGWTVTQGPSGEDLPAYKIARVDDISADARMQFHYHIVVRENPTAQELASIADSVIEQAKVETPFNQLMVELYDRPQYVGRGTVYGIVEYSPNGVWDAMTDVPVGDYSSMRAVRRLETRDWSKRPTAREVRVWQTWETVNGWLGGFIEHGDVDEADVAKLSSWVGALYGMSGTRVDAILEKRTQWGSSQ